MPQRKVADATAQRSQSLESERQTFLSGVSIVEAMVDGQAQEFSRRNLSPPGVDISLLREVVRLEKSGAAASERLSLLVRMLEEVFRRQKLLDEAAYAPGGEISLEAFVGAAHKIRTALDVALNCSGEIADIVASKGSIEDITAPAQDAARAARWATKYAEELSDLALLGQDQDRVLVQFSGNEAVRSVLAKLKPLAMHSGIDLNYQAGADVAFVNDQARFERCLHYLLIWALDGKGVKSVRLSMSASGETAVVRILDDGEGASIEERAAGALPSIQSGANAKRSADGAGYAMARRLAYALKGQVSLTTASGRGAQIEFVLPKTVV